MANWRDLAAKIEFSVLAALVIIAGGLWGFVESMELAAASKPHAFDTRILLAFREAGQPDQPIGPHWMEDAVRDVTSLGSASVLIFIALSVVVYLLIVRHWLDAFFVFVAVAGGQMLSSVLKLGIDRPRPELVPHLADVYTLSFPSGHAMLSAVTYLTLGALATRIVPGRATRLYVLAIAILATFLVGASRVYLGVHWPSDVLAGWCAGSAWAMLCWLVPRFVPRRPASEN